MENLLNRTIEKFGKIDIFINNAGMGCPDGFLTINDNLWFREINVNLSAVIDACNLIIPYFERQGYGCILSTSSLCGRIAATVRSIYAITKCCVNVYTSSLAEELADKNIRVNAIAPGMVGTDMVKKIIRIRTTIVPLEKVLCYNEWENRKKLPQLWSF